MSPKDEVLLKLSKDKDQAQSAAQLFKICTGFETSKDLSTALSQLYASGLISRTFATPPNTATYLYWNEKRIVITTDDEKANAEKQNQSMINASIEYSRKLKAEQMAENTATEQQPINALQVQIAGDHYKTMKIQPVEYIMANNLDFCEGNIIKYVSRYKNKNGVEDLKKARHFLDILIEQQG